MKALILSAGLGTRLLPYTTKIPKCAFPLLNLPLFAYNLYHLKKLGIQEIYFNLHHRPLAMKESILKLYPTAEFSFEVEILDSGGALRKLQKELENEEEILVCNGDSPIFFPQGKSLNDFVSFHRKKKSFASLLTTDHPLLGKTFQGLSVKEDQIVDFYSKTYKPQVHFVGYFLFSPKIFSFINKEKAHIFKDVLAPAIKKNEKVFHFHEKELLWLETGSKQSYLKATQILINHLKEKTDFSFEIKNILEYFYPSLKLTPRFLSFDSREVEFEGDGFVVLGNKASFKAQCDSFCVIGDHQSIDVRTERSVIIKASKLKKSIKDDIILDL